MKDKAVEIIQKDVKDQRLRRRMLHLLELIPEKKSLLLAQKAMNYRKIDDVMDITRKQSVQMPTNMI